jgi:hypothetical protein
VGTVKVELFPPEVERLCSCWYVPPELIWLVFMFLVKEAAFAKSLETSYAIFLRIYFGYDPTVCVVDSCVESYFFIKNYLIGKEVHQRALSGEFLLKFEYPVLKGL